LRASGNQVAGFFVQGAWRRSPQCRAAGRALVERGWALGTSPWQDVSVVVSPEHVVIVNEPAG